MVRRAPVPANAFDPMGMRPVFPTETGRLDGKEPPPEDVIVSVSVAAWS